MLETDKNFKANPAQLTHEIEGLPKELPLLVEEKQHDVIEGEEEAGSLMPLVRVQQAVFGHKYRSCAKCLFLLRR